MNGNITKEAINLDLEWMKRSGIGGFQTFDAALATPQLVDNPGVKFFSGIGTYVKKITVSSDWPERGTGL